MATQQEKIKMDPKTKFLLFQKAPNFCSAPWNLLYVEPNGDVKLCSPNLIPSLGNIHNSTVEEILYNPRRIDIKSKMLENQEIPSCSKCKSLENLGAGHEPYEHLRNMYNTQFLRQEVNYTDTNEFILSAVDLHWSSICDLKCVTCWPWQSSSIALEQGLPINHVKTATALKLIDMIVEKQSTLKEVYLSGGEPSLIKYNLNLLTRLEKRDDLLIRVNTNMMWDQDNAIIQEVLKFPKVLFTCSADNTNNKFEYIRRGASWNRFIDNLNFLSNRSNVELRINSVFFVLSALDLINTIDYFYENYEIENFTINQCNMGHSDLRCRNLPDNIKILVQEQLEQAKIKYSNNLALVGSFNNCLVELNHDRTESYIEYFNKIDNLANTSFKDTFPKLL